jgi:hypothetical protein
MLLTLNNGMIVKKDIPLLRVTVYLVISHDDDPNS